jgi:hypothetical protein
LKKEEPKCYMLTLAAVYLDFKLKSNRVWTCPQLPSSYTSRHGKDLNYYVKEDVVFFKNISFCSEFEKKSTRTLLPVGRPDGDHKYLMSIRLNFTGNK